MISVSISAVTMLAKDTAIFVPIAVQVENLRQLFPHVPATEVESALQAVNGDVDEAASVIMLRNSSGLLSMPVLVQSFSYSISFITG